MARHINTKSKEHLLQRLALKQRSIHPIDGIPNDDTAMFRRRASRGKLRHPVGTLRVALQQHADAAHLCAARALAVASCGCHFLSAADAHDFLVVRVGLHFLLFLPAL